MHIFYSKCQKIQKWLLAWRLDSFLGRESGAVEGWGVMGGSEGGKGLERQKDGNVCFRSFLFTRKLDDPVSQ